MNEKGGLEHSEKMATHAVGVFFFTTKFNEEKWRLAYTKKF
jgi:hypothetical protein